MNKQRLIVLIFISLGIFFTFLPFEIIGGRTSSGIEAGGVGLIMDSIFILAALFVAFIPNMRSPLSLKIRLLILLLFLVNSWLLVLHNINIDSIQFEPLRPGMPINSGEVSLGIGYYLAWAAIVGGVFLLFYKFRNRLTK